MLRPETAGESKELGEEGGGRANRIASHLFSSKKKKKKKKFRSRSSAGGEGEERERDSFFTVVELYYSTRLRKKKEGIRHRADKNRIKIIFL